MDSKSNDSTRSIQPVAGFKGYLFCERAASEERLTPTALRVAFVLLKHSNEKGTCFPGDDRIAKEIGHVGTSHVAAALKLLDDGGLIECVKRSRGGGFRLIAGSPLQGEADQPKVGYQLPPLQGGADQTSTGGTEVEAPSNGKEEEEPFVVSATSTGGIPTFSDEAVDAVWEETAEGTRSDPEPVSGADAAERPLPYDEKLPADLRRRKYTYLIDAKPTKKGDNFRAWLGDGKVVFVDSPVVIRDLKPHIGKLIRPDIRPGVTRDTWVLRGFKPAPTPEERRGELWRILVGALQGREHASSLDDIALIDPILPGFAETLDPGKIIAWVREQAWPCPDDRIREVLDHLGMHDVEIPEAVPGPETEPEPEAGTESNSEPGQAAPEPEAETVQGPVYELPDPDRPGRPFRRGTKDELQEFLHQGLSFTSKEASRIVRERAVLASDSPDTTSEAAG